MASIINKVKDALYHENKGTAATGTQQHETGHGTTGLGTGHNTNTGTGATSGPHDSRLANAVDPTVNSHTGTSTTGTGLGHSDNHHHHNTTTGIGSTTGAAATDGKLGYAQFPGLPGGNHPHHHVTATAEALDPHIQGQTGTGLGSSTVAGSNNPLTHHNHHDTAGPHRSDLANKADPRVDSDRDGSRTAGNYTTGSAGGLGGNTLGGTTGSHTLGGTTGSNTTGYAANQHGVGNQAPLGSAGLGSHGTSNTAGPHNSNLLNKIDSRVDSDLDGSRTAGTGNSAYTK